MISREPGSPEDAVVQWLDDCFRALGEWAIRTLSPYVESPYMAIAVVAVLVYFIVVARRKKG